MGWFPWLMGWAAQAGLLRRVTILPLGCWPFDVKQSETPTKCCCRNPRQVSTVWRRLPGRPWFSRVVVKAKTAETQLRAPGSCQRPPGQKMGLGSSHQARPAARPHEIHHHPDQQTPPPPPWGGGPGRMSPKVRVHPIVGLGGLHGVNQADRFQLSAVEPLDRSRQQTRLVRPFV